MVSAAVKTGKTIILVRHGLSEFNAQGRMQGSSDESLLSDIGKLTARDVGTYLNGIGVHRAVSSSLVRVKQTAETALSLVENSPALQLDYELRETELYQWEGLKLIDIRKDRPEEFHAFKYDPANFSLEKNGQQVFPIRDLYQRACKFWRDNVPHFVEGNNLVVSHGGTIQALINTAMGLGPESHHSFQPSNCGVSCIDIVEAEIEAKDSVAELTYNYFTLKQLNNTVPLGEKLPKLKAGKEGVRLLYYPVDEALRGADLESLSGLSSIDVVFRHVSIAVDSDSEMESAESITLDSRIEVLVTRVQDGSSKGRALKTFLIVAPDQIVRMLLTAVSGVSEEFVESMTLHDRMLTVVHHVYSHPVPILQCVNIPVFIES